MQFPQITLPDPSGNPVILADFWKDEPAAFVFLRHLGCIFCHEHLHALQDDNPRNAIFVSRSDWTTTAKFLSDFKLQYPVVCDGTGQLYSAMGLERGNLSQVFGPKVVMRGAQAWKSGHRPNLPPSDPFQLGGCIVVNCQGEVVFTQKAMNAADNVSLPTLDAALLRAKS